MEEIIALRPDRRETSMDKGELESALTEEPIVTAAEDARTVETSGSWSWGSLLKATTDLVGKQSTAMVEFMKRDLTEFSETMQKDTAIIMNDATQSFKDKISMEEASKAAGLVKSGISSFFGSINASLTMFEEQNQAANSVQEHQTRSEARLNAIQHDPNTFQKEPTGRPEDFEAWLLMFDVNQKRQEMERLLDSVDVIQEFYDKFVPLAVTHNEFWQRYFYRVYQYEKDEKRIQSLMARSGDRTPDDLDWGDEDDGAVSPSTFLDPSEVGSVVSNESFQMLSHEPVAEREVGDAILVGSERTSPSSSMSAPSRGHKKQESTSSLGDWDHDELEDTEQTSHSSRDDHDTPTPE